MSLTTEYRRKWKEQNPEGWARQAASSKARTRALQCLRARHVEEFRQLEEEERLKLGLPKVGASAVGRVPRDPVAPT